MKPYKSWIFVGLIFFTLVFLMKSVCFAQSEDIVVFAQVDPNPSEFQLDIISSVSPLTLIQENTEITYQITYGSLLSYSTNLTVEAIWADGLVIDEGNRPVNILDYVAGSATNGYGGGVPVIDLINHKITWEILSIPSNTLNQTLTFKLKTNNNYQGSSIVDFTVSSVMTTNDLQIPVVSISNKYKHSALPDDEDDDDNDDNEDNEQAPTVPDIPTGAGVHVEPIKTPIEETFKFINIEPFEVLSSRISFEVETNQPAQLEVLYGTSPDKINKSIKFNKYGLIQYPDFSNLEPNTKYYFVFNATNTSKKSIKSDIYFVKTSEEGSLPEIKEESIIVTANKNILHDTFSGKDNSFVVIPKNQPFEFKFGLNTISNINKVEVKIKEGEYSSKVLGIKTKNLDISFDANEILAFEINPGYYFGKIKSPSNLGLYKVFARIYDINGNILEKKLFDLKVIENFRVIDEEGRAIEDAQIYLYTWNFKENIYEKLKSHIFSTNNPIYTDIKGEVPLILPQGMYSASVLGIGYKKTDVQFELSPFKGDEYPTVRLKKEPFNIFDFIKYYWVIFKDVLDSSRLYGESLSNSFRFYKLNAFGSIIIFAGLFAYYLFSKFKFLSNGEDSDIPQKINFKLYIKRLCAIFFEFFLIIIFIFELFLLASLGFYTIWPFFMLSVLNLIIWFFYIPNVKYNGK